MAGDVSPVAMFFIFPKTELFKKKCVCVQIFRSKIVLRKTMGMKSNDDDVDDDNDDDEVK